MYINPTGFPPDARDDDLLTLSEAAAILRTSKNNLRYWRQSGKGPRFFKIGRRLHTTVGELRGWLKDQMGRPDRGVA